MQTVLNYTLSIGQRQS